MRERPKDRRQVRLGLCRGSAVVLFALLAVGWHQQVFAQERVVYGQVIDSVTGEPLRGTSAYFTTSRLETHSDDDGLFLLHGDTRRDSVLVVRRIGFVPRSVIVSPLTNLPVVDIGTVYLRPVATQLDEI